MLGGGTFSEMAAFINDTVSGLYCRGLKVSHHVVQMLD